MLPIITPIVHRFGKFGCGLVVAGLLAAAPAAANADRWDHHDDYDRREHREDSDRGRHDNGGVRIGIDLGAIVFGDRPAPRPAERVWVEPVYQTVCEQQTVPAQYRTVIDHRLVPESTRVETRRVWVPETETWQDVVRHGRVVGRERVCVPGHYEDVAQNVCVPAHYEDCPRQELVCDAHVETVTRQVLVTPGHWETRPIGYDAPPQGYYPR